MPSIIRNRSTCEQPVEVVKEVCREMYANGRNPILKHVHEECMKRGVDKGTAQQQTYLYRVEHDLPIAKRAK